MKLLQNVFAYCAPRDVAAAQAWSNGGALRLLAAAADPASAAPPLRRAHALYGLCNVAVSGAHGARGLRPGRPLVGRSPGCRALTRWQLAPFGITSGCRYVYGPVTHRPRRPRTRHAQVVRAEAEPGARAGEEEWRGAVMASGAVPHIVASLADADHAVRLAAVWCGACRSAAGPLRAGAWTRWPGGCSGGGTCASRARRRGAGA